MTIRNKLHLTSAVVVILIALLGPAVLLTSSHLREEKRVHEQVDSLQRALFDLQFVTQELVWHREDRMFQQWYAKYNEVERDFARLSRGLPGKHSSDPLYRAIQQRLDELGTLFGELSRLKAAHRAASSVPTPAVSRSITHILLISRELAEDMSLIAERTHSRLFHAQRLAVRTIGSLSVVFMILGLASIVGWLLVVQTIIRRVQTLVRGMQCLGRGNLDYRVPEQGNDEVGEVAVAFNHMMERLKQTTVSLSALTREVDERRRAERLVVEKTGLVDLLQKVAAAVNAAPTIEVALGDALKLVGAATEWQLGHIFLRESEGKWLHSSGVWYEQENERFATFRFLTEKTPLLLGVGVPGKVAVQKRPIWTSDYTSLQTPRSGFARDAGIVSCFAFPILSGQEVLGVAEFFSTSACQPSGPLLEAVSILGVQLARVLERSRADRTKTLLATLVQSSADALITTAAGGKITSWNPAAEALFGLSAGEAIGRSLLDIFPEGDGGASQWGFARQVLSDPDLAQGNGGVSREIRGRRANGEVIPLLATVAALRDVGNRVAGLCWSARDITEVKRAEAELREKEARFRILFEGSPMPMWVFDAKTHRFLEVNEAATRAYGYSREEFLTLSAECLRPGEDAAAWAAFWSLPVEELCRRCKEREWRHCRKDGSKLWVQITLQPVHYLGHEAWLGISNDVSERHRVEEQLRNEQSRLNLVLAQMPAVVWSIDRDWTLSFLSGSGLSGIGSEGVGMVGTNFVRFLGADNRREIIDAHEAALVGRSSTYETEWRGHTFVAHTEPLYGKDPEPNGVIGVALNITERKQAEESLRRLAEDLARSNQELEEFAYIVSHDLQEPLRMVTCYLNLVRQRYAPRLETDGQEFVAFAVDGATRMKALIADLLAYSRAGNRTKPVEVVEGEKLMGKVVQNLKMSIEETGAEVTWSPLPAVAGDMVALTQLFQNLVANAIKFRRPGSKPVIGISAESCPEGWLFRIEDNGIGIAPEYRDRIFHIFQRLHTREEYPGSGLGLAICKKIVQRYGGRIWVEPKAEGGSRFLFTLPPSSRARREPPRESLALVTG